MFKKDLTGNKYGKLTVIEYSGKVKTRQMWLCKCDCSNYKNVSADSLVTGNTKSCGKCPSNTYELHPDGYMIGYTKKGQKFLFDRFDFHKIKEHNWYINKDGYVCTHLKNGTYMHRYLIEPNINQEIDHIDGNRSNNKRDNLRICNSRQNKMNKSIQTNNKSGYKGVYWDKQLNKWRTRIKYKGKHIHVGLYSNLIEAAIAYNKKAVEYFGEYAKLNQIKENP